MVEVFYTFLSTNDSLKRIYCFSNSKWLDEVTKKEFMQETVHILVNIKISKRYFHMPDIFLRNATAVLLLGPVGKSFSILKVIPKSSNPTSGGCGDGFCVTLDAEAFWG